MRLRDKIAVITGASRGIGREIALAYAREGATVVLASRKAEQLEATAQEVQAAGGQALAIPTHTGYADQCAGLIDRAIAAFGRVDVLVNNAATNPHFGPLLTADAGQWQKTLEVNLLGYFWLSKHAAEAMQQTGGGVIVNMASVAGLQPMPMLGLYSVTKAAVIMLTKALAQELAPHHIRVNAIAPGVVRTRFAQALWENDHIRERIEASTPLGRLAEPAEIAGAAIFLASDAASYITGHVLVIDGGGTISGIVL